jgi:hypothetical protein
LHRRPFAPRSSTDDDDIEFMFLHGFRLLCR